jgi:hypothetical protein
MPKKSDELNAVLAETIRALPSTVLAETARELREAGLHAEADRVEEILAERDSLLGEARAAKAAEEAAAHAKAVSKARAEFDQVASVYESARDDALSHLAAYAESAQVAMSANGEVGAKFQALVGLLGPNNPELPELPSDVRHSIKHGPHAEALSGLTLHGPMNL